MANITGPLTAGAARIYVLHEEDWDRAVTLMRELSPPADPKAGVFATRKFVFPKWALIGVCVAVVVLLAGVLDS